MRQFLGTFATSADLPVGVARWATVHSGLQQLGLGIAVATVEGIAAATFYYGMGPFVRTEGCCAGNFDLEVGDKYV